jgi:hypothetical protein
MTTNLLICTHPGCYYELPTDCFPADARNIRRAGRATRCYDCESARTRKGNEARPGSRAAQVAVMKASGIYRQYEPAAWTKSRAEATAERKLSGVRERSRRKEEAYLPLRWDERIKLAKQEQALYGTPSRVTLKLLNRWAPLLGKEVPPKLLESPV